MKLSDLPKLKPLIEAMERGDTIQVCVDVFYPNSGIKWEYTDTDIIDPRYPERYRIKPKPREWRVRVRADGGIDSGGLVSIGDAGGQESEYIKVREVVE